jgi:hypothetical protein
MTLLHESKKSSKKPSGSSSSSSSSKGKTTTTKTTTSKSTIEHRHSRRRSSREAVDLPPRAVSVLGAGYLGSAIAAELALCGVPVQVFDGHSDAAAVFGKVDHSLSLNRESGTATQEQTDKARALVKVCGSVEEAVDNVDLVIEAIPEDMVAKQTLFALLDTCTSPNTILTTNALTIPLHHIAHGMRKESRHRVVGLRFLMPVTLIPMVELSGDADRLGNGETMDKVASYMAALGKFCFLFRAPPSSRSNRRRSSRSHDGSSSSSGVQHQADAAAQVGEQRLRLTTAEATTHQLREARLRADLGVAPRIAPRPRGPEAADNSDTCVVCLDRKADAVVVSCGHRAFCLPCAVRLNTDRAPCPLCRTTMRGVYEEVKRSKAGRSTTKKVE